MASLSALVDVGRGLREGFFMFWETLWALILGFSLSGAVQAFVSKDQMRAKLGDHRPLAIARASGYGMVSSSCSYAASAMAKSLFAKGADFTTAMVFMFASTNLVVELGVVMFVLLGWQFAAAEFVGGPLMIVLLAVTGGLVFTGPVVARARSRVRGEDGGGHDRSAMSEASSQSQAQLDAPGIAVKLRSAAAWSDASRYAMADATMLRRELVIGYVVAGQLATLVPTRFWNDLFVHGHGPWTSVENALVGPLIAVISWVCSIGNVPLAAALWAGGISFGGVIAFIFADLIAMPLILIYRKLYGTALTLRMVGLFYVVMAVAGLVTQIIFSGLGAIPSRRAFTVSAAHFSWNYTTFLNLAFIVVALGVWWLARHAHRFGGGVGYALDPVCGMQVRTSDAPATSHVAGHTSYFCSDHCRDKFEARPEEYGEGAARGIIRPDVDAQDAPTSVDPVCGMSVDPATAPAHRVHEGVDVWFCNPGCAERFDADPQRYLAVRPVPAATSVEIPLGPTASTSTRRTYGVVDDRAPDTSLEN
ncbi:MAG: YHS domain-containing protein [Acidobacteria bacterium]|nr:YHS domain-containing protein [Acidobacteriota bacterium]